MLLFSLFLDLFLVSAHYHSSLSPFSLHILCLFPFPLCTSEISESNGFIVNHFLSSIYLHSLSLLFITKQAMFSCYFPCIFLSFESLFQFSVSPFLHIFSSRICFLRYPISSPIFFLSLSVLFPPSLFLFHLFFLFLVAFSFFLSCFLVFVFFLVVSFLPYFFHYFASFFFISSSL